MPKHQPPLHQSIVTQIRYAVSRADHRPNTNKHTLDIPGHDASRVANHLSLVGEEIRIDLLLGLLEKSHLPPQATLEVKHELDDLGQQSPWFAEIFKVCALRRKLEAASSPEISSDSRGPVASDANGQTI